jgi:transcriptional regulator with XRE-family HTH domain
MRNERERIGITLTEMAERTGYAKSYLSTIETGQSRARSEVISKVIAKYEEVLGLDQGTLLSGLSNETSISRIRPIGSAPASNLASTQDPINFRDSLPTVVLANLIGRSKRRIWILENWIGDDLRNLADSFLEADKRGVDIQIAILQENSPFSEQRTADLRLDPDLQQIDTDQLIIANKRLLASWLKQTQHMHVRVHNTLPSIQVIIIDDTAEVGFYFHGITSRGGPQLEVPIYREGEVKQYTTLGFYLEKEFEYVWGKATDFSPR